MSWPVGVVVRQLTASDGVVFENGDALPIESIQVEASRDLVWAATGQPLKAVLTTVTAPFDLPVTDQDGWLFQGLPVDVSDGAQSHTYTVRITYEGGSQQFYSTGPFVLPEADGSPVDVDTLASLCTPDAGTISIPDVSAEIEALQDEIDALTAVVNAKMTGAAVSTDGSFGLPSPTGVGMEFVWVADVLSDIRFNGVSG